MSNVEMLGKILEKEQKGLKDAVHVAVVCVMACGKLYPGQDIEFVDGSTDVVKGVDHPVAAIGIVDPFLRRPVFPEERFWMFLNPGTVTQLRHDWEHPAWKKGGVAINVVDTATGADVEEWSGDGCSC